MDAVAVATPARGWKHWTQAELALLRELAAGGDPAAEIAAELGRTANAVRVKAANLGVALAFGVGGLRDELKRAWVLDFLSENPGATIRLMARSRGLVSQSLGELVRGMARDGLLVASGSGSKRRYAPAFEYRRRS